MAPLSSVEQTQMPAKRWVLKRVREWLEEGTAGVWLFSRKPLGRPPGVSVPADSPSLSISAGSEWKSVEVTPGGKVGILR